MSVVPTSIERPYGVLFVCHDNNRSSLIAEAVLNDASTSGVRAFSAGVRPSDHADPFTLSALALCGISHNGLWPKHWLGFCGREGQIIDTIVMIGETMPEFLPRAFIGTPDVFNWEKTQPCETNDRHKGVWQEIQSLRPRVLSLVEEISGHRSRSIQMPIEHRAEQI